MIKSSIEEALYDTAMFLMTPGMGILAADESNATMSKRLEAVGVTSTPDHRRDWRELLFRTQPAMDECISGVILYDETIRQNAADGTPIVKLIEESGALPGIKVDTGAKPLANAPGESVTEGLDGLRDRLRDYSEIGARFTKWRAVFGIDNIRPSQLAMDVNAQALARYSALAQEAGLVPIVEPEVLMEGFHSIDRCFEATEEVLRRVFYELAEQKVLLEGIILKPNMVVPGDDTEADVNSQEVADKTLRCLKRCVPVAVPGITFLSGGQSDVEATAHLDAMVRSDSPWPLSFSYGRALQQAALKTWAGHSAQREAAQEVFAHRCKMNSLASQGDWTMEAEKAG
jgi:fructose-bisphosphate aldolase class I